MGAQTLFLVEHWHLALGAAALGFAFALAFLVAEYLVVPAWRLSAAHRRGPGAVEALLRSERRRLRRLEDKAAVSSEHGRPEERMIHEDARIWRLIVGEMERKIGGRRP